MFYIDKNKSLSKFAIKPLCRGICKSADVYLILYYGKYTVPYFLLLKKFLLGYTYEFIAHTTLSYIFVLLTR